MGTLTAHNWALWTKIIWLAMLLDVTFIMCQQFLQSHEKSHRLWTKNQSLARGLLAHQTKILLGINFLGPWEGGIWSRIFFNHFDFTPWPTYGSVGSSVCSVDCLGRDCATQRPCHLFGRYQNYWFKALTGAIYLGGGLGWRTQRATGHLDPILYLYLKWSQKLLHQSLHL